MFEILQALMAMKDACDKNGSGFWFELDRANDGTGRANLKVEVSLDEDDMEFYEQFKQLVGP